MIKRIIFQKQELFTEITKSLEYKLKDIKFGIIEKVIDFEEIVIDTIEIKCDFLDDDIDKLLGNITDFYKFEDNKIIIELTDLREYISKIYNVEITEVYDFFECNLYGDMTECISFEII